MDKKIFIVGFIIVLFFNFSYGLEEVSQNLNKNELFSKIDMEHRNTRKYVSDELTRQREQFFKEIDGRAGYYEKEGKSMLSTAYLKLGLIWGGVVFLIAGLTHILRLKTERVRFNKLHTHLSNAILKSLKDEFKLEKENDGFSYKQQVNPEILTDKVQDILDERSKEVQNKLLDKHYNKLNKKQSNNELKFSEEIIL